VFLWVKTYCTLKQSNKIILMPSLREIRKMLKVLFDIDPVSRLLHSGFASALCFLHGSGNNRIGQVVCQLSNE